MSIPFPTARDKGATADLLVATNPVWEVSHRVERLPEEPEAVPEVLHVVEDGGGSALNTACALALAGRRVVARGRTGDDPDGRRAVEALERRGVFAGVDLVPGRRTLRIHLFVERATAAAGFRAERHEGYVDPRDCDPPEILDARWLLIDRAGGISPEALARRRAVGLYNAVNLNTPSHPDPFSRRMRELFPSIDLLQLAERGDPAEGDRPSAPPIDPGVFHRPPVFSPLGDSAAAEILAAGPKILVRTRGRHGVVIHTADGETLELPAAATPVVDPTGAGDAFLAGFLDALIDGREPLSAAQRGLAWAARAVRHLGARGWLDHEPPGR